MVEGSLSGFHSYFAVNPTSSFGVVALMTGQYSNTLHLALEAIKRFQPALDYLQSESAKGDYAGEWKAEGGRSAAHLEVIGGSLWISKLEIEGVDVFESVAMGSKKGRSQIYALWSTGRRDEFRYVLQSLYFI